MSANEGLTVQHPYQVPEDTKKNLLEVLVGKNIAKANPATYKFTIELEH